MNKISFGAMVLLLAGCAAAGTRAGGEKREPVVPLSKDEAAQIRKVEAVGRLLYDKDVRAAAASDIAVPRLDLPAHPGFVGWVTHPNGPDYTVSFYERSGDGFRVLADVAFNGPAPPQLTLGPNRLPSEAEVSMMNARIAAIGERWAECSDHFNTVVVPGDAPDRWDVYVLSATINPRYVLVGGHVKVSVSKADGRVLDAVRLAKTCVRLDKSPPELPEGATPMMLYTTHLVSDYPIAIHPYLNLLHKMPLAIRTRRGIWFIRDGNIRLGDGGGT
jgi:hypothetical protein